MYPPATLELSIICKELDAVEEKWFEIGLHLGVPYYLLQEFKKEDDPLAAVFDYYLKDNIKDSILSWKYIVDVLKSEDIGGRLLAESINKKYCQEEGSVEWSVKEQEEKNVCPGNIQGSSIT